MGYSREDYYKVWDKTGKIIPICGIQKEDYYKVWDTTEKIITRCGIQCGRLFRGVGYNREDYSEV